MSLSPKSADLVVLLPQDREIMAITGLSEPEYREFVRELRRNSRIEPGTIVNLSGFEIILINLVIGIVLTGISMLLRPKPQAAPRPNSTTQVQGQSIVNGARYTPNSGFDSPQNVVELGSVVPIVYANRQVIDGVSYGGIRVNTNLLWSQIYSVGGGQLLRSLFLVSEAQIQSLDATQFAIGNQLINNYDLRVADHGRISIYYSPDGGRLRSADHIAGTIPANDLGNSENSGGRDVFQVRGADDRWMSGFCFASSPSNQAAFGLSGFMGNNFPFKVNPVFRPAVQLQPGDTNEVRCPNDWQAQAQRVKQNTVFSGRSGIVGAEGLILFEEGDTFTYTLFSSTDQNREIIEVNPNGADGVEGCGDVAQTVAGRQKTWDDTISLGELYRVGSCVAICTGRTEAPFVSEADGSGSRRVDATFEVVRPGLAHSYSQGTIEGDGGVNASRGTHLYRFAEAVFATDRESRIVEVGFKSSVQLQISGLCNFRDTHSYRRCDDEACFDYNGQPASGIEAIVFQSGTYSSPDTRYSFFKVSWRVAGTDNGWTDLEPLFAIRSATGVALYNYLRLECTTAIRWEVRFTPVSAWEVRSGAATGDLHVLDPNINSITSVESGEITVRYTGERRPRARDTFALQSLTHPDGVAPGPLFDDEDYYADAWARVSEAFIYNEISTSASSPEHQIVYVNTISDNAQEPTYDNLALVGVNLRSSTELNRLDQFSVYVNQGVGATSRFPDVLYDLLTNKRYGAGRVMNERQVDKDSFDAAAVWTTSRRYFFDGAVSERINLRSWGAEVAANYLLDLVIRNGRFALRPVANFGGPETITGLFTSGNILEDSFEMSYFELQERQPIRVSVRWRQEKEASNIESRGLFPVMREVSVREVGVSEDAPLETVDLGDYCTSQVHAIDVAKWKIRSRRLIDHSVKFKTTPTEASLDIGSVFKLGLETVTYDQPANGAIAADGTVTSWPPLADGSYPVLFWDGTGSQIQETELIIQDGRCDRRNAVFCLRNQTQRAATYKTQSVSFDEDGNIEVEAAYFPTDETGTSLLTKDWNVSDKWIIEGEL